MLEVKNLTKIYYPKHGVAVTALNAVNLYFPDKGMIFLLGKSGSGKSTLLNLLGGLDGITKGEIVIRGKSSKGFTGDDFDSYRNTFIGFVFQEFYVLEDYTVEENIALALQLQKKEAGGEKIADILRKVDLEGYGKRKPTELSGGQKQRVAIARALVKSPEIILADEPTGALDSVTGMQVFETLKKLSKEKLVIVVSHDRDNAENYADRIIELKDGSVINDLSRSTCSASTSENTINFIDKNTLYIKKGRKLTQEDVAKIEEAILSSEKGVVLSADAGAVKGVADVSTGFVATRQNVEVRRSDKLNMVKSKLPAKIAFRMGASSLKLKKVRLAFTIILSFIALFMFSMSDVLSTYDSVTSDIKTAHQNNALYYKLIVQEGYKDVDSGDIEYWYGNGNGFTGSKLADMEKILGAREYCSAYNNLPYNFFENYLERFGNVPYTDIGYRGTVEMTGSRAREFGFGIKGDYPVNYNEIAVTNVFADNCVGLSYYDGERKVTIGRDEELIGLEFSVGFSTAQTLKITAIVDIREEAYNYDYEGNILEYLFGMSAWEYTLSNYVFALPGFSRNFIGDENYFSLNSFTNSTNFYLSKSAESNGEYFELNSGYLSVIKDDTLSGNGFKLGSFGLYRFNIGETLYLKTSDGYSYGENIFTVQEALRFEGEFYSDGIILAVSEEMFEKLFALVQPVTAAFIAPSNNSAEDISLFRRLASNVYDVTVNRYIGHNAQRLKGYTSHTGTFDSLDGAAKVLKKVFLYVSIVFCVFSGLLFMNFIGISVASKKKEIGILRALGARSKDVFAIFFAESAVISLINLFITFVVCSVASFLLNASGGVSVFNFGIRQIFLTTILCAVVAIIATLIPVNKFACKKPVDAINNR